jgi:hypothetical protein
MSWLFHHCGLAVVRNGTINAVPGLDAVGGYQRGAVGAAVIRISGDCTNVWIST